MKLRKVYAAILTLALVLSVFSAHMTAYSEDVPDGVPAVAGETGSADAAADSGEADPAASETDPAAGQEQGGQEQGGTPAQTDPAAGGTGGSTQPAAEQGGKSDAATGSTPAAQAGFDQTKTVSGIKVRVTADKGVFPEGAVLSVTAVTKAAEKRKVTAAVENERAEDTNVVRSYTFDIKVLDASGNELQPADQNKVKVSFSSNEVKNTNLNTDVYHVEESKGRLSAEALEVETSGSTAVVETAGFSYYQVEFTYDNKEYVLEGDGVVKLEDLLTAIGLTGEVESFKVSDPSLFDVYRGYEDGVALEIVDEMEVPVDAEDGDVLYMVSLEPFETEEWLDVRIGGITYRIAVTDGIIIAGNDVGDIPGIEQGDTSKDFTANMPIATIWIDESKINMSLESREAAEGGLTDEAAATGYFLNVKNMGSTVHGTKFIALNLKKACANLSLPRQTTGNHFAYEGKVAEFLFKGAAQDAEGNELDIVISYSNLRVNFQNNITQTQWNGLKNNAAITLWEGNMAHINAMQLNDAGDGTTNATYGRYQDNQRVGAVWDTNVQVVYPAGHPKAGQPVDGTFYFPMVDVDVKRTGSNNTGWNAVNHANDYNNYSEQLTLYADSIDDASKVYIPGADTSQETNYGANIRTVEGGWEFSPNVNYTNQWDRSFYTGFMTLIDNNTGVHMQNQFGGIGNAQVETYFMAGSERINFKLKSSTTTYDVDGNRIGGKNDGGDEGVVGGRIQTTQYGNKNGMLSDSSRIIDESTIATARGQKVTYTMTPEPGYRLKGTVKISKGSLDYHDDPVEITPKAVLDENGMPKYYTFEFFSDPFEEEGIAQDNAIHVEWEPTKLEVAKEVVDTPDKADDTFKFRIRIWNPTAHDEKSTYMVRAYKEHENLDITEYSLEYVDYADLVEGEQYYMFDDQGYFMKWNDEEQIWERTEMDPGGTWQQDENGEWKDGEAFPLDDGYIWTYGGTYRVYAPNGNPILQRKNDYALVVREYEDPASDGEKYWYFAPSADNHAIDWEHGYNERDTGGGSPEDYTPANRPSIANHYGIVNGGEHKAKFYKLNTNTHKQYDHTHEEYVQVYRFTPETPSRGGSYLIYDGAGSFMGWDSANSKFIRFPVDLDGETREFDDIEKYIFKYNSANAMLWGDAGDKLVHDGTYLLVGQQQAGSTWDFWDSWYVRWEDALGKYRVSASTGTGFNPIQFFDYEVTMETISVVDDTWKEYFDFSSPQETPEGLEELLGQYEITPTERDYYVLVGKRPLSQADFEMLTENGWVIESLEKTGGPVDYDIAERIADKGGLPVAGTVDTFEFSITTENYEKTIDLNGIVPVGWSYEITEIGEHPEPSPGTLEGWEYVSKTGNASVASFDGDESGDDKVVFRNRRDLYDLTVKKETVNHEPGDFAFTVRIWKPVKFGEHVYETGGEGDDAWTSEYYTFFEDASVGGTAVTAYENITIGSKTYVAKSIYGANQSGSMHEEEKADLDTMIAGLEDPELDTENNLYKFGTSVTIGGETYDLYANTNVINNTTNVEFYYIKVFDESGHTLSDGATFTVPDIPSGYRYKVTESVPAGWRLLSASNDSGTIEDADVLSTFLNAKTRSLTIQKETDYDTGEEFDFRIRIWQEAAGQQDQFMDLSGIEGISAEGAGVFSFKLKNGESITIPDIPYGFKYEVWEVDKDGMKVNVGSDFQVNSSYDSMWTLNTTTNDTGTIENDDINSSFRNEIKRGDLEVIKNIATGSPDETFKFRVKFTNPYESAPDPDAFKLTAHYYVFGDEIGTQVFTDDGSGEVSLQTVHDARFRNGVRPGTDLESIVDDEYNWMDASNLSDTISIADRDRDVDLYYTMEPPGPECALNVTYHVTFPSGESAVYGPDSFVLGYTTIGDLHLFGTAEHHFQADMGDIDHFEVNGTPTTDQDIYVSGEVNVDIYYVIQGTSGSAGAQQASNPLMAGIRDFADTLFTVPRAHANDDYANTLGIDFSSIGATLVGDDTWEFTITTSGLTGNKLFENIPYGIGYEVWELDDNGSTVAVGGLPKDKWKLIEKTGDTGTISDDAQSAAFTNEKMLDLTISKTIAGSMGDREDTFEFTLTCKTAAGAAFDPEVVPAGATKTAAGSYKFTLGHNDSITFTGLPYGTQYTVNETAANENGYETVVVINGDDVTNDGKADEADIALDGGEVTDSSMRENTEVKYTNSRGSAVPTGTPPIVFMGGVILGVLAAIYLLIRRKLLPVKDDE